MDKKFLTFGSAQIVSLLLFLVVGAAVIATVLLARSGVNFSSFAGSSNQTVSVTNPLTRKITYLKWPVKKSCTSDVECRLLGCRPPLKCAEYYDNSGAFSCINGTCQPNPICTSASCPTPSPTPTPPTGTGIIIPKGVFSVSQWYNPEKSSQPNPPPLAVWQNSCVTTVHLKEFWKDVQPNLLAMGGKSFNWTYLDSQFDLAAKYGKHIKLDIPTGFWSPQWLFNDSSVQKAIFIVPSGNGIGSPYTGPLPLPWDTSYQTYWFNFLQALANRYLNRTFDSDKSQRILTMIGLSGPNSQNDEMRLPGNFNGQSPQNLTTWQQVGYTPEKYEQAWYTTFANFQTSFNGEIHFSLALYPPLPLPATDPNIGDTVRTDLAKNGSSQYPTNFTLQTNGLNAVKPDKFGYSLVGSYSTKINTGFMINTSATNNPDQMGGPGSTPLSALRDSINRGLSMGPNFLEIYQEDILNKDLQTLICQTNTNLINSK